MTDVLQRVRELVVQGGNDAMSQKDRYDMAAEIDQLISQAKYAANATYNGRYIFAGEANGAPPYQPDGPDAFAGTAGAVVRTIGPGLSVRLDPTGGAILATARTEGAAGPPRRLRAPAGRHGGGRERAAHERPHRDRRHHGRDQTPRGRTPARSRTA